MITNRQKHRQRGISKYWRWWIEASRHTGIRKVNAKSTDTRSIYERTITNNDEKIRQSRFSITFKLNVIWGCHR